MGDMFDLDQASFEFECPICRFQNPATLGQVRLGDVVICRGCKSNIQLADYMAKLSSARKDIQNRLKRIEESFPRNLDFTL